jgi:uridine kinase
VRIAIDGRSAAGKTTLADRLAERLTSQGRTCMRASIDDFHPPGYKHRAAAGNFGHAEYLRAGYDYAMFQRLVLEPLAPGASRRCRLQYWHAAEDRAYAEAWVTAPDDAILIVDGAFLLLPALRPYWELTIWLDVSWETMLSRAMQRDVAWVGSADVVRERYTTHWMPRHKLYERAFRPRELVDIVINNDDHKHAYIVRLAGEPAPL